MRIFGQSSGTALVPLAQGMAIMRSRYPFLAKNVEVDDRVSIERALHFAETMRELLLKKGLEPALVHYAISTLRSRPEDTYLSRAVNGLNLLSDRARYPQFLCHVLSLNALARYLAQEDMGWKYGFPGLNSVTASQISASGVERIDQVLNGELANVDDTPRRVRLVTALLTYHADQAERNQLRPAWAADWERFEAACENRNNPDRWTSLVGVYRKGGCWLIVLKYPSSKVGQLVRPTQLDAGAYDYHFPSPGSVSCDSGGASMNLDEPDPVEPLREFVHRPIRFDLSNWEAAGWRLDRQRGANSNGLQRIRERHLGNLRLAHGGDLIDRWWDSD